ncbi:MAG TPA: asparagine synthase (glutamine-hydrolyzing) [Deltaproteobacteria bacterium]|nr:MAG: asparagine synthase (glutamine-hydrolyzing) [Deltaproteobacteria bacterium GWA2_55_82]OGQ62979.1 MAG: asparagine synthase (glutamine-hydrolyzing) [Deltaproteobacteria bacterium RIFCSPLOWO2_02_FULL_55_12]OIJ72942.1 MAG: asparagine synthase (glutamine-hydrolyzing) [Deltaproteobacteria bacterium GWC2_55_46]HBG46052.1 asparagine synthase (glutamine-hydrolyzing) [Deltaproteobacteria bacterium]HCY11730.1 asparagine synthase (glutamine-hydrolyzing) [Deltaproteobacteria bacterium]
MCGICGKLNFNGAPASQGRIDAMTDIMEHRGPDDRGTFLDGPLGLGHRRLSILDLSPLGHQPMMNEDSTVAVVFNGEIYNYIELRDELRKAGHSFRSSSDTEVIVHAYEEYGAEFASRFNGMFAIAVWDTKKRELTLVRDRLGIKPLYYHIDSRAISFASEIKSLLEDPEVPRGVDMQALSNFLTLHYVPGPRTMFDGIQKLQPGHMMTVRNGQARVERYWGLKKDTALSKFMVKAEEEDLAGHIYSALKESVKKRMQSDVPVGALLSGGLDSSAILGLMTELAGKPVPSFTVGYSASGDDSVSEFRYSRKAARHFESNYREVVVTAEKFLDFLPKAIWHQDEPIGEPASIPLYFVSRLAKENGVTVLLTGEGSDELFAGYNRHWGEVLSGYYLLMPGLMRDTILKRLIHMLPGAPLLKKGHRSMSIPDFSGRYMSWHTVFTEEMKQGLLNDHSGLKNTFSDIFERFLPDIQGMDNIDKILTLDTNVWLPDDLLMKKDKMGMATSIEARVPFLDYTFVELAFQVPARLKVKRLVTKYILKKALERLLPKEIIYRKKEGFPTPISGWIRGELKDFTIELLCSDGSLSHGLFDKGVVRKIVEAHLSGREDNNRMIFPLINFEIWHRLFISRAPVGKPSYT